MLTKLAFKNMSKSMKTYAIYFFTLILAVSIFYMFNSIYAQQEIMEVTKAVNQSMHALRELLSYLSVFVAIVLGFLIVYANNFFIKRRKKELGIYLTLGMEKIKISLILLLETSIMAFTALAIGLVLGVVGSQFMSVFTASIFEADMYKFKFIFSVDAAIKSIIYFSIIFIVVIIFNTIALKKYELIDLIYGSQRNENIKMKNIWLSLSIFLSSCVCLCLAYSIILKNGITIINLWFLLSIILGAVGTVLFFFSVSSLFIVIVQSNHKLYFRKLNIFIVRQLSTKINTDFVSLSVVCLILFLVMSIFSTGYSVQKTFSSSLKEQTKFDFSLFAYQSKDTSDINTIFEELPDDFKELNIDYSEYTQFYNESILFEDFDINFSKFPFIPEQPLNFMTIEDYNEVLAMQQEPLVSLLDSEYMILSTTGSLENVAKQFLDKNVPIRLEGESLAVKTFETTFISNNSSPSIVFVVPNRFESYFKDNKFKLSLTANINVKDVSQVEIIEEMLEGHLQTKKSDSEGLVYYFSKQEIYEEAITTKAIISFLAMYLGIVFMITATAILAIQQISQAADNKHRYELLTKLGVDKTSINNALFFQILWYFLLPLLLAILHSTIGLIATNDAISLFGQVEVATSLFLTSVFIIVIYGSYFLLTYMGSKNILFKK